jgi:hypothetical protein
MRIASTLFLSFSMFFLTSFSEAKTIVRRDGINPPSDSFGFIVSIVTVKNVEKCAKDGCEEGMTSVASASSIVIQREAGYTRLLTAGHACSVSEIGDTVTMVQDFSGEKHFVTAQIYSGTPDLCLLETDDEWGTPLKISLNSPKHGDRVWNMAAPSGIFAPGMLLLFDGYYSGRKDDSDYYTISAAPGSSGSAILNSRGDIIGIVHSAILKFTNLAACVTQEQIISFLKKATEILDERRLSLQDEDKK